MGRGGKVVYRVALGHCMPLLFVKYHYIKLISKHKTLCKLDVFEKNACLPLRVPPCALLKEGKERDMTVLKRLLR